MLSVKNQLWESLGFFQIWLLTEKLFENLLKCLHLFFNLLLAYFDRVDNLKITQQIRDINIPNAREITIFSENGVADNVSIQDSGDL